MSRVTVQVKLGRFAAIALLAMLGIGVTSAYGDEAADRIDHLLTQNELARQRVRSGHYRYTERSGDNVKDIAGVRSTRTGEVTFDGRQRLVRRHEVVGIAKGVDDAPVTRCIIETRAVVSQRCAGLWQADDPMAYQYDHESPESLRAPVADRLLSLSGTDWLNYGHCSGPTPLREVYQAARDSSDWRVEERRTSDGQTLYILKRFSKSPGGKPFLQADYTLNADRGFLVTGIQLYAKDGTVASSKSIQVGDVTGKGDWLPLKIEERAFARTKDGTVLGTLAWCRQVDLSFDQVNEPVDPASFEMKALGLPEGLLVHHEDVNGIVETYKVFRNTPMPAQLAIRAKQGVVALENLFGGLVRRTSSFAGLVGTCAISIGVQTPFMVPIASLNLLVPPVPAW